MTAVEIKAQNRKRHILIVDDEEIALVALGETLRQLGYTVATAWDAMHGLLLLRQHQFAVIVTDHQMPDLTCGGAISCCHTQNRLLADNQSANDRLADRVMELEVELARHVRH